MLDPCKGLFLFHKCCCCSPCLAPRRLASRRHAAKPSHLHQRLRICRCIVLQRYLWNSGCHRRARPPNTWKQSCSPFSQAKLAANEIQSATPAGEVVRELCTLCVQVLLRATSTDWQASCKLNPYFGIWIFPSCWAQARHHPEVRTRFQ